MTRTEQQSDLHLRASIVQELAWSPDIVDTNIEVAVNDGAVTLFGEVDSYPEKSAAVKAALRIRGVTAIADEIQVEHPWAHSLDGDLARQAAAALNASVILDGGSVKATVHERQIYLSGSVAWNYQRAAAQNLMANLAGVRNVHNGIALAPTQEFSPNEAETAIKAALLRQAQLDADRISVSSEGTEIELTGTVSSWSEYRQVSHAAWAAPGVTNVKNHLAVLS